MKLGPRSCKVCGPRLAGCWRCDSKLGHRHLVVISRKGTTLGRVAACDVHSPPDGVLVTDPYGGIPEPAGGSSAFAGDLRKRTRDRAYRLATSIVRERHYDEFAEVYRQVLTGEVEGRDAA